MADDFQSNNVQFQQAVDSAMKEQKKQKKKKRLIILGIILAVIVVLGIALGGSSDDSKDSSSSSNSSSSAVTAEKEEETKTDGVIGDYVCTVKSAKLCKDWTGKDAVKITYVFTNNSNDAASFDIALTDNLYQDGIGLESAITDDDDDWGIDVKIKPGTSKEVSKAYLIRDKSTPIDVEIEEFISFSDDMLTYVVELE